MINKKILAGALAGLLGIGTCWQYSKPSLETIVKKDFDSFPLEILGAGSVKKYETEGAKYCLVHIKQVHVTPQMSVEARLMTGKVQSDIYSIISNINHHWS